jgi:hypothetical protein
MAWQPQPASHPSPGWWITHEFDQWVASVGAELRAKRQAEEQAKRLRQLRRRVERVDEQIVLAQSASEARRNLRRQGLPYERGSGRSEVEHGPIGRILSVS